MSGEQDQVTLQKRFFFNWNHVARLREEFNNDLFAKHLGGGANAPSCPPLSGPLEYVVQKSGCCIKRN